MVLHTPPTATTPPDAARDDDGAGTSVRPSLAERAGRAVSATADADGAVPAEAVAALHDAGLLLAPFPAEFGGEGLAVGKPAALMAVLAAVGRGDLALGRLYEGHVNAVALVVRYGSRANLELLLAEARAGRISGVWMAGAPLRLSATNEGSVLHGRKILCSGCGLIRRPLVAADGPEGSVMLLPLVDGSRTDLAGWTVRGMRASATGDVDLEAITIAPDEIVGQPGDYLRSPFFRGGAWRVLAVQLGGVEAVMDCYARQLRDGPHRDHPVQLARYGEALIAAETARLWVAGVAVSAEAPHGEPAAVDAAVDLARNAFEASALKVIGCAEKAIGLKAFQRTNPLERIVRDLQTYLRQPALDASLLSAAAFHLGRET